MLCRIDIQARPRKKPGAEFGKYVIPGACNPPLAHAALQREIGLGLLLPCNAVVYEKGGVIMEPVVRQVNAALRHAVDGVCGS